jgi:hypothetical protein
MLLAGAGGVSISLEVGVSHVDPWTQRQNCHSWSPVDGGIPMHFMALVP